MTGLKPRALLITPPVYDFAFYDLFCKPYGLLKIAAWLEEAGWETVYVNSLDPHDSLSIGKLGPVRRRKNGTGKIFRQIHPWPEHLKPVPRRYARYGICRESLKQQIASVRPDIILITSAMTYWYEGVREAVEICRKVHKGTPVVVGGVYATLMEEHCRQVSRPDYVVTGEGEGLIPLLEKLSLPAPSADGPGEVFPVDNPVWKDSAVIRLNRGCPMNCDYCASKQIFPRFIPGDPGEIFERVREINKCHGTRNFAFYDDALLVNRETRIMPFLEKIISWDRDLRFYLPNAVHARYLDRELLNLMDKAGFQEIRIGYESDSDDFHKTRDNKINHEILEKTMAELEASAFPRERMAAYVLAGLPGQKAGEVERAVRKGSSYGIRCRIAQYSPVPGSVLWEESCRVSPLPLESEPLYHNSSFFAMEWEGFTRTDLERIKTLSAQLAP